MTGKSAESMESLLSSDDAAKLHRGLEMARNEFARVGPDEGKKILEMVSSIFYLDPLDHPELVPALDEAISLVSGFGDSVIPFLVNELETTDVKAQLAAANALGRMGDDAIDKLIAEYNGNPGPAPRSFIIYSLGKIKSPAILRAMPLAIESCSSADLDLRDTATRAIGKFAESIPGGTIPDELRKECLRRLREILADQNPGIRAKAVMGLGKFAKFGHLAGGEKDEIRKTFRLMVGEDENFSWDRAFLVRKEAKKALEYL